MHKHSLIWTICNGIGYTLDDCHVSIGYDSPSRKVHTSLGPLMTHVLSLIIWTRGIIIIVGARTTIMEISLALHYGDYIFNYIHSLIRLVLIPLWKNVSWKHVRRSRLWMIRTMQNMIMGLLLIHRLSKGMNSFEFLYKITLKVGATDWVTSECYGS